MAGILELWRSRFKQSNPSTLTAGGLSPNFILTQPRDDDGDGEGKAVDELGWSKGELGESGLIFSSRKRASCANGFAALLGGEPRKYGPIVPLSSCKERHMSNESEKDQKQSSIPFYEWCPKALHQLQNHTNQQRLDYKYITKTEFAVKCLVLNRGESEIKEDAFFLYTSYVIWEGAWGC